MDKKAANLAFHHSERLKSNLFLISAALERLASLKPEEVAGGREVSKAVFLALGTEINMARRYVEPTDMSAIETGLSGVEAAVESQQYQEAREQLGRTFSAVTSVSNKYIGLLMEEGLV